MAHEFIARKGLIVPSGSILVTSGSVTASNFVGTASLAVSSSYATTASFALNAGAGSGFPFSGSAVITGSLNVTQGVTASFFKGDGSQLTNLPATEANAALRIDSYTFESDGITTNYILSQSYYTAEGLVISVGGITYTPTIDYTVSSSTLTFIEVPASESNIIIRAFVAVSSGSIEALSGSFVGTFTGSLLGTSTTASYVEYVNVGNKPTLVSSSAQILLNSITGTTFSNAAFLFPQDVIVAGTLTAEVFKTEYITSSVIYESGSTKFGDSADDTHQFTGSVLISGPVTSSAGFFGTSSWASDAISSSYAVTASYAMNGGSGGSGFPFSGSAVITGSLNIVNTLGGLGAISGAFSGSGANLNDLRASLGIDTYTFVGNGVTTNYYLSQSYTANSLIVSVEGMTNIVDGDYTLSGPTMSFAIAPPSQSNILVKAFLVVSSGSYATYTGSFIGNGSGLTNLPINISIQRQTFTGNGSTQNYILSQSYIPSGIVVTVGGLRYIDTNDYTLSGTTLQFVQAPPSNSIIVVDAFVNAGSGSAGIFSGSFLGTASYATSASFASNVLKTKAGSISYTSFGGTPLTASVTFSTSFPNTNFAVAVTGEDARSWTIESKTVGGFTVNSNSNTALTGTTYWTCTAYGEN